MTVFLTTQYLEEADVLADRVGIIDHGKIVAEGTPAELKAEIGRPSVQAIPHREEDRPRIAEFLAQFGEPLATSRDVAVRLRDGLRADRHRARDRRERCRRRRPRAARADARRRLPREDRAHARRRGRGSARRSSRRSDGREHVAAGRRDRPAVGRPHVAPAGERHPAAHLPDRAHGRERRRPALVHRAAGLPDRLVPRLRARGAVHPGRALLDDERRHRSRARHPDRLHQPPLADGAARLGAAHRTARRCRRPRDRPGDLLPRRRSHGRRPVRVGARGHRRPPRLRGDRRPVASARSVHGLRSGRAPARRSRRSSRSSSSSSSSRR